MTTKSTPETSDTPRVSALEAWFDAFDKLPTAEAMRTFLTENAHTLPGAFGERAALVLDTGRAWARRYYRKGRRVRTDWHPIIRAEAMIMKREHEEAHGEATEKERTS